METKKKTVSKKVTSKPAASAKVATSNTGLTKAAADAGANSDSGAQKLRRKELVERIVATTGKKPNEVKSVLDGVLLEIGKALSAGEDLNLHPLGKISVNRHKKFDDREIIICKIRRKVESDLPQSGLKTAAE